MQRSYVILLGAGAVAGGIAAFAIYGPDLRQASPQAIKPVPIPTLITTTRPSTKPAVAVLNIDGRPIEFPRSVFRIEEREDGMSVQIYSDDAKPAAGSDANAYYFDLELGEQGPDLNGAQWHFLAANRDRLDSPTGISLSGGDVALQPFDVTILFSQHGKEVTAQIDGEFLAFAAQDDDAAEKTVHVSGQLRATPRK